MRKSVIRQLLKEEQARQAAHPTRCQQCHKQPVAILVFCRKCYQRLYKAGVDMSQYPKRPRRRNIVVCPECGEECINHAHGYCENCFNRLRAREKAARKRGQVVTLIKRGVKAAQGAVMVVGLGLLLWGCTPY